MDVNKINEVISILKLGYEKPGRYFLDFSFCVGFVKGINWACYNFGVISDELHYKTHKEVAAELGWEYLPNSPAMLIKAKDWDEEKKILELLKIEIAVWERILEDEAKA